MQNRIKNKLIDLANRHRTHVLVSDGLRDSLLSVTRQRGGEHVRS